MKLFADGCTLDDIEFYSDDDRIHGFTTNPTLLHKSQVKDYLGFAQDALSITEKPISLEVLSDAVEEIEREAWVLASLADNVHVKIPVTTTSGEFLGDLIGRLSQEGVKINVTAVMTCTQMDWLCNEDVSSSALPWIISVFAGRIADTGRDPRPYVKHALRVSRETEILWASPRCALDYYTAEAIGCNIITMTPELIVKLDLYRHNLSQYSNETVRMFHADAVAAGYVI